MNTDAPVLSHEFQRLYCAASVFEEFSALHPVSFLRVLPFQARDLLLDTPPLLAAEAAHLANPNDTTRLAVLDAFAQCNLLSAVEVANLKPVIDVFGTDFFEFMGEVYANAGMFICALRWYREFIAELERRRPGTASDDEDVYANVGYCLYSLGLFPEAITWSKSCIGPCQTADTVNRVLINYEAQLLGGCVQGIERTGGRTRYTVNVNDPKQASHLAARIKEAMDTFAPFQEAYIAWANFDAPLPEIQPYNYPFQAERDAGCLPRHRLNLVFALCGQADALVDQSYEAQAKRFLFEAALLEPQAEFVRSRIEAIA